MFFWGARVLLIDRRCQLVTRHPQPPAVGPRYSLFESPTTNYFSLSRIPSSVFTLHDKSPLEPQHIAPRQPTFTMSTAENATSYAALILADDNVEITVRKHHLEVSGDLRGAGREGQIANVRGRPTSSRPSSRPLTSMLSLSGPNYSPRYEQPKICDFRDGQRGFGLT